jgi:two-component system, NarL family, sensor histidine kinase BarA
MSGRAIALAELLDAAALDEVVRSYAEFHGVGLSLVDTHGKELLSSAHRTPLCEAVRSFGPGRDRCDRTLRDVRLSGECDCFTAQRYQVASLEVDGQSMGKLVFGPYWPGRAGAGPSAAVVSVVGAKGLQKAAEAASKLPPLDDAQALKIVRQVARVVTVLLQSAYTRHVTAQLHLAAIERAYAEVSEKNERMAHVVDRLKEADRLKSNFLCTISHELRTPLTSVIGYSEMLLEGLAGQLNEEQREYVRIIMEKGDQLLQLITAILDVSRIESGTLRLATEPVDVSDVIAVAVAAISPLARRKRLDVSLHLEAGAPRVLGDRDKIRQILINLLGNAIKFTPDGGKIDITVEVGGLIPSGLAAGSSVTPREEEDRIGVRLVVRDNGIGIPKEKQGRIFDPFFQVDSSSTREYGGTGLGLALVKSFVEAHGGHVWVDSDPGTGASFTATFPCVPADLSTYLRGRKEGDPPPPRRVASSES